MTPEEKLNAEKSQLGKRLHAELQSVLAFADPEHYASYRVREAGYSQEQLDALRKQAVEDACQTISQGAKLDTYYNGKRMPLHFAMEIYLVSGDAAILNAMTQREANPAKINMQQDFEYGFVKMITGDAIRKPDNVDGFLTLLEATKGGKKLLERTWPKIANHAVVKYARYFNMPLVLKTFQEHGYDVKGTIRKGDMEILLQDLKGNLDWCQRDLQNKTAKNLKPVLEELLAHYTGTEAAIAPSGAQVPEKQILATGATITSPEKVSGRAIGGSAPPKGFVGDT